MWYVLEIQKFPNGTWSNLPPTQFADKEHAESKWHELLMYAAVSSQPLHGALLIDGQSGFTTPYYYEHPIATEE